MALKTRGDIYNVYTNIKTENIYRVSSIVSHFSGVNVQPNKAIVGKNAFLHESGIHQHGVLENRETYEIMTPESVGFKTSNMILGKHSGRHAFEERVKELGCNLDDIKLNEAFKKFKDLADKKKEVSDKDIEALIYHGTVNVEDKYKLINFSLTTCNKMSSTATVNITYDGKDIEEAACGDGPVNALYNAVERAINKKLVLKDYNINAITSGADALGEVIVKLSYEDKNIIGRSVSTNVIEASIMAYMNALNKIVN
ncbi:leuA allosteric domain protein [Clostridium baratii str. Sullivan]|uniref:2-isopropylmalate synthase n=2 Tax=Clostridium baratii TaxID=1561 RepID=A0A0A7FST7_9CLOT|nr:leuA allosteric domain protein [Clostridium baratii str. Sullivan]